MQTKIAPNYSSPKYAPAFGAIKCDGAQDTLKRVLKTEEARQFLGLVQEQRQNNLVDIILFGKDNKLSANVSDVIYDDLGGYKLSRHSQRLFEAPMKFIKRMCSIADKRAIVLKQKIEKNEVLDDIFKNM